ncbi:MAG: CsbD family protein [Thermoguttaceae bacterium]
MNWEQIKGSWNQVKGQAKEKWGELTDDELTQVAGKRDQLLGVLQRKYGYAKEEAEKEVKEFENACNC